LNVNDILQYFDLIAFDMKRLPSIQDLLVFGLFLVRAGKYLNDIYPQKEKRLTNKNE
jgi:hypothetical protein